MFHSILSARVEESPNPSRFLQIKKRTTSGPRRMVSSDGLTVRSVACDVIKPNLSRASTVAARLSAASYQPREG